MSIVGYVEFLAVRAQAYAFAQNRRDRRPAIAAKRHIGVLGIAEDIRQVRHPRFIAGCRFACTNGVVPHGGSKPRDHRKAVCQRARHKARTTALRSARYSIVGRRLGAAAIRDLLRVAALFAEFFDQSRTVEDASPYTKCGKRHLESEMFYVSQK